MKINPQLIPLAYKLAKAVYDDKLKYKEAILQMSMDGQMNAGSAKDYIDNFNYMMKGRKFSMTLNKASLDYFMSNINQDYGTQGLSRALVSLYLHIEYYEKASGANMNYGRVVYNKYKELVPLPIPVRVLDEILKNIETLEDYLVSIDEVKRSNAQKLVKQGTCFLAYRVNKEVRYAPSRYLGYIDNHPYKYLVDIDGRETNKYISDVLGTNPLEDDKLERGYIEFCKSLGFEPSVSGRFGVGRKYWMLELDFDFENNAENEDGFPEGKMVERLHKSRERNSKVIELAKRNFKAIHGALFCQVCKFDYSKVYGKVGDGFIEGHHTIWVSDMQPDYKTKVEEIALLCANCHRMVHRKRPWLTIEKLNELLKQK